MDTPAVTNQPKPTKPKLRFLQHPLFLQHDTADHPENRKRLEQFADLPVTEIIDGEPFLELIHTKAYIQHVKEHCLQSRPLDNDTQTSPQSYYVATRAVGAAIMAAERNGFALLRPPGHHAYPDRASGFCLFNNIAVAAQKLVNEGKRVAIIDFDGHHGDGTAFCFQNTDQVLVMSLHQYPAFPYHTGWYNEIGDGAGEGYTINIPLPAHSGDDIFWDAIQTFTPVIEQFKPDVVGISAGFDAHQLDFLLDLNLSINTYYKLGKYFAERFENMFAVLEGGYNTQVLYQGVYNFMAGALGLRIPFSERPTESPIGTMREWELRCHTLIHVLSPYWKF